MEFTISRSIIEASGVTSEFIINRLQVILDALGRKTERLIGTTIRDTSKVQTIIELADIIIELQEIPGFQDWVSTITPEQAPHAYSVGRLATIFKSHLSELCLEPTIVETSKKCDFSGKFGNRQVFFECKNWEDRVRAYLKEHQEIANKILECVHTHHQISFEYSRKPSDDELRKLLKNINERMKNITGTGNIIYNDDFRVHVSFRSQPGKIKSDGTLIVMGGLMEDTRSHRISANHVFIYSGRTISIEGPKVEFEKEIRELIKRGSSQAPVNAPFILVIDVQNYQGGYEDLHRTIYSQLQPKRNTRFSGILLVNFFSTNGNDFVDFIQNPFARNPISSNFSNIVKRINEILRQ
jgi:hypothetical protein